MDTANPEHQAPSKFNRVSCPCMCTRKVPAAVSHSKADLAQAMGPEENSLSISKIKPSKEGKMVPQRRSLLYVGCMEDGEQSGCNMDFVKHYGIPSIPHRGDCSSLNPLLRWLRGGSFPQGLLFPNMTTERVGSLVRSPKWSVAVMTEASSPRGPAPCPPMGLSPLIYKVGVTWHTHHTIRHAGDVLTPARPAWVERKSRCHYGIRMCSQAPLRIPGQPSPRSTVCGCMLPGAQSFHRGGKLGQDAREKPEKSCSQDPACVSHTCTPMENLF